MGTVQVKGSFKDASLTSLNGRQPELVFRLSRPGVGTVASDIEGQFVSTADVVVTPASSGAFTVSLTPNDLIQGDSWYQVVARWLNSSGGATEIDLYKIRVPRAGGWVEEMMNPNWRPAQLIASPVEPDPWPIGWLWANTHTGVVMRRDA